MLTVLRRYSPILVGIGLLLAVYLLPPDTSLAQTRKVGVLTACVPTALPPLVTGDANRPGIEVELMQQIAAELGVTLSLNTIPAMGTDFNPRSWHITRAQCAIIAGGLADTVETRSYLAPGPSYGETGWTLVGPAGTGDIAGQRVGVLATLQGGDRIALSSYLRSAGATAAIVRSAEALAEGIAAGTFSAGIADAMTARLIAAGHGWTTAPLPPPLQARPLILGLWKGDLTLKRAVDDAFARIAGDGRLKQILDRYAA
jgi:polar amino acid transport system substrate-binding protein/cystine transport system substrate-binding protein/membrane-bound lytic murein transglycosylase F